MPREEIEKKIFEEYLTEITRVSNQALFWKDKEGYYLGYNKYAEEMSHKKENSNIFGKTDYELWPDSADVLRKNDLLVMTTGKPLFFEEELKISNEVGRFIVLKVPRRDDNNNIIGVIGNILNVTTKEERWIPLLKRQEDEISRYFNEIASSMPGNFYWKNKFGCYIGCNSGILALLGYEQKEDIIGKTDYDLWPDQAKELRENDIRVMEGGITAHFEEIVQVNNETKYYAVIKTPFKNAHGEIVGIIGNSIDITSRKKAESLTLENELYSSKFKAQEKFRSFVCQVVHDIRSPLVVLSNIVKSCNNLTEKEYVALRNVAASVQNIANNLLYYEETKNTQTYVQHMIVSLILDSVVKHREYQHKSSNIEFYYSFLEKFKFVCIKGNQSNFFRMISNAVNNAVEAIDVRRGVVDVRFVADDENVKIIVQDNGKGIPRNMIDMVLSNKSIASTKGNGRGLGMEQMRSALKQLNGKMQIESKEKMGTKISFIIPRADSPSWMVNEIVLYKGGIVVILDDDSSIYHIWMARLAEFLPDIIIKFFESGIDAIEFLSSLKDKERLLFLTDYELRYQKIDGGDIIQKIDLFDQSIIVTGIYADDKVQALTEKHRLKILPKQFIENIPITIKERINNKECDLCPDVVIVDDCQYFADSVADIFRAQNLKISVYQKPSEFLRCFKKYGNNTKFVIDNEFESDLNGLDIVDILHNSGYKNICLLSGRSFNDWELPAYVKFIQKTEGCFEKLLEMCRDTNVDY